MAIIRGPRPETSFYTVDKQISEDERLSWAARGMLIFLLGKPDGWQVSVKHLVNETQFAIRGQLGRDGVKAILAELGEAGYLTRSEKPRQTAAGHMDGYDYFVSEVPTKPRTNRLKELRGKAEFNFTSPSPDFPSPVKPSPVEPSPANPHLVNNEFEASTELEGLQPPSSPAAPAKAEGEGDASKEIYSAEFLAFWDAYPRKQGKLVAFKRWKAAVKLIGGKRADAIATLLAGAQRYAKEVKSLEREKIKMAEGWLTAGRWEDEEIPEASDVPLDWWKSAPGYDSKAASLGIAGRGHNETHHAFRLRVILAAGEGPWRQAELDKAMRDNAHGYADHLRKLFGYVAEPPMPVPATVPRAEAPPKSAPSDAFKATLANLKSQTHGLGGGS
jgi:hypothetical protein